MAAHGSTKCWHDRAGVEHAGAIQETKDGFFVIECTYCKFKHVVPLPTPNDLDAVYSREYYTQDKPFYIDHYLEDQAWWDGVYAHRLERLERELGKKAGRILDVGSGPGLFLSLARQRGWEVKGVEPSTKAADYSRNTLGLDIASVFLTPITAATLGAFDVVNMGEVLEHLPDPTGMLKIANNLLVAQGLLCIVVPNDFNPFQMILQKHRGYQPWWVAPPHHLNYFNVDSLSRLVQSVGFDVIHVETTFPIDMFLLMGENYIGKEDVGRRLHGLRKTFEKTVMEAGQSELLSKMYTVLGGLGIGREIVLYARKTNTISA